MKSRKFLGLDVLMEALEGVRVEAMVDRMEGSVGALEEVVLVVQVAEGHDLEVQAEDFQEVDLGDRVEVGVSLEEDLEGQGDYPAMVILPEEDLEEDQEELEEDQEEGLEEQEGRGSTYSEEGRSVT